MKLPDPVTIAKGVAPPPAEEVKAVSLHALKKLPSSIGGACEFLLLFVRVQYHRTVLCSIGFRDSRYTAQVAVVVEDHVLVTEHIIIYP